MKGMVAWSKGHVPGVDDALQEKNWVGAWAKSMSMLSLGAVAAAPASLP